MFQDLLNVTLLNEKQAADILNLSVKTPQTFRITGQGSEFIRVSQRCIRYRLPDLLEWQTSRRVASTSEPCPGDMVHRNLRRRLN